MSDIKTVNNPFDLTDVAKQYEWKNAHNMRIVIDVKVRDTAAGYNALKVLLVNGSLQYQYTPQLKDIHDIYVGAEIPIICQIRKDVKDFDNLRINHINFRVESVKLFRC